MYQELEMWNNYKKEKQLKAEKNANIQAIIFFIVFTTIMEILITYVNQFTIVNRHTCGIAFNIKISIKQKYYFYNVNTSQVG